MKNLMKNRKLVVVLVIIILVILFIILMKIIGGNKSIYGDRCSDKDNYKLSNDTINKAKDTINELGNVSDIDIYTKLCTVKIIIELEDDVELDKVKNMSNEILKAFSAKELKYYDFSLYVTSKNENSETYPINVTKHNSKDNFAW